MQIRWPEGKKFAFTIFDDPDSQTLEAGREVYAFLRDLGFRTTKAVWPSGPTRRPSDHGATCADAPYLAWLQDLQMQGFEMAFHNATSHTSDRQETLRGLNRFRSYFGADPASMAHHYACAEGLYWGDLRVTGANRLLYNLLSCGRNYRKFCGDRPDNPHFWADLCQQRIKYVRNFVFADINTLRVCPEMPYHDPRRPSVNYWFAASEGAQRPSFVERLSEANQDRLAEEGGACIMYVHFGHGFYRDGALDPRFRALMSRLSGLPGWFAPVSAVLDHLLAGKTSATIGDAERRRLERRWLFHKVRFGTA